MKHTQNLIAYFSKRGENYFGGKMVDLPVGNTEVVAKKIQGLVGGDLFEILPAACYPHGYSQTVDRAKQELRQNARPAIVPIEQGMEPYDTIYIGYPNWCGTMPMPVFTFLESYDFFGKTLIPFCTHEGSGLGRSESDIKKLCPGATVLDGLAIRGGDVGLAEHDLLGWSQNINKIKQLEE